MPMRLPAVLAVLALAATTACTADGSEDNTEVQPVRAFTWAEHPLPPPPGPVGRAVVRDAVHCGGAWYVAGAVFLDEATEDQDTRPALWRSADGQAWKAVRVEADTFWGQRAILNSIACSRGRIAVVGARSGGAHGNPRVTTYHLDGAGVLVDVEATFTQYGGISATNVGPVSGGPPGWLIAGNRLSGPGVWVTDDPTGFHRVEGEPGLTDDGELISLAEDAAWAGEEWVLVGSGAEPGSRLDRDPLAWASPDGLSWTPESVPASDESEDVNRVTAIGEDLLLAVGIHGSTFGSWTREDGQWSEVATFGRLHDGRTTAPYAASLAPWDGGALTTASTGGAYELWRTRDGSGWEPVQQPLSPSVASDHAMAVATHEAGDGVLLVVDDGTAGRVWAGEPVRE